MKKISLALATLSLVSVWAISAIGGEKSVKLMVVSTPTSFTNIAISVRQADVRYVVDDYKSGVYADFSADHGGKLKAIRIVMNDATVYEWDCQYRPDGKVDLSQHAEDGEHLGNTVTIKKASWVKFFQQKVAMPAFNFEPDSSIFSVCKYWVEFVGYMPTGPGIGGFGGVYLKVEGTPYLREFNSSDFVLQFPTSGKFYLGMKDGKFIPLQKVGDEWSVLLVERPTETKEFPSSK
ncbi:MAG: hypothetical protein ABI430_04160 [Candidatus Taylorbacteria bacterium]